MLSASLYITVCSARNRVRVRLRRLREPRYLVGAVVGVAYFYFAIVARGRGAGRARPMTDGRSPFETIAAYQMIGTSLAGLAVFASALSAWVLPGRSGLLEFSEAETDMLVPAPVSRRQLLLHRIVRSQTGSLIASVLIAIFVTPLGGTARLRLAMSVWALLVTVRVYYAAVTLTRARLRSASASVRRVAWLPIGLFATAFVVIAVGLASQLRPLPSGTDFWVHVARAVSTGPTRLVLWPFVAILRPALTTTWSSFAGAFAASLVILAALMAWMLANDVVLDSALEQRTRQREEPAAPSTARSLRRSTPWALAPSGRVEFVFLWKGAIQTFRAANFPVWRYLPPLLGLTIGVIGAAAGIASGANMQGPASFVTVLGCLVAGVATVFGPQMMRADLRSDFEHLDVLKTWPVRAGDVIRGEMAWPVVAVSGTACLALLIAALFSGTALPNVPLVSRWSVAIAWIVAAPSIIAAQYAVHNAATIAFPAWVPLGSQARARGIDAMGQRLILLAAILLSLLLLSVPGAIASGAIWLTLHRIAGAVVYVPMAVVFAAIMLAEVIVVTELLGPAYEGIDVTSVERPE